MVEGKVTTAREGHVMLIGLDRVLKRNAFDVAMYEALSLAYAAYEHDDEARCAVLFAHGDHFTGGLDLAEFSGVFAKGAFPHPDGAYDPLGLTTRRVSKPIVCAVQGICFTIGIELLLATDVRVAAKNARFGQIEVKRGIYPVGGATIRLPREIGWGNAMRYLLTGDEFGAEEARRLGLVQEVTEPGLELERAKEIARAVAAQAPLGVRATIKSARVAEEHSAREAAMRLLPDLQPILSSDDAREGLASFLERRAARFSGK